MSAKRPDFIGQSLRDMGTPCLYADHGKFCGVLVILQDLVRYPVERLIYPVFVQYYRSVLSHSTHPLTAGIKKPCPYVNRQGPLFHLILPFPASLGRIKRVYLLWIKYTIPSRACQRINGTRKNGTRPIYSHFQITTMNSPRGGVALK